ncbi:hypothetical protein EX30DRAFT_375394 [Ascodesmis nigricans]|uniref:ER-bound oxygenase mpaB/mpaB'/Rubber oxygenase catalytic domain-containing protein n=1 Tax=Ascodesmis nigricans TaxID=341454 RepID=A0A4S2MPU1_9PEZI|nr:hypothetical protein EX30DRAFT_375394 [Ascodesmis nigricans]
MASLSSLPSLSSFPSLASLPAFPSLPTLDRIQIPSSTSSLGLAAVGGLVSYLALVRGLRYRQREQLAKQFGYHGMSEAEIYEKLTLDHAQEIMKALENREFPFMFNTSLQFALFRTYAIPSISRILKGTKQLSETSNAGRRYADTIVLIAEFSANALDSERGSTALARMNHLHSLYPSIKPGDTLYTLLLFITQPPLFFDRFEWRKSTPLERAAITKFWIEVGVRMKIPREDIPTTYDAMMEWAEEYEKQYMVPADSNNYVAEKTVDLLVYYIPTRPLRWVGRQFVIALLDDRLRIAMKMPEPYKWAQATVYSLLWARKMFLRYFSLPRFTPRKTISEKHSKTGKYHLLVQDNEPWYVERKFWDRWGPWALIQRIGGWPLPGDEGFGADGYEILEVGPRNLERSEHEKVLKEAEEIRTMGGYSRGGCPFH